jgi:very-short-patch-repair endonuclease
VAFHTPTPLWQVETNYTLPQGGSKARNEPSGRGLPGDTTMTANPPNLPDTTRTRSLRKSQTTSEGLLWSVLRAKQLCGLRFRRQHRIEPWIVDFACPQKRLAVEIDGGYHDNVVDDDLKRQQHLEALRWKVIRFSSKEVEEDAEAVARTIARALNLPYAFEPHTATGSGMMHINAPKKRRTQQLHPFPGRGGNKL